MHLFSIIKSIKPKDVLFLTLAGIINAVGVTLFIAPVNLYDSGISGTSIFLSQVFSDVNLSVFLLLLNVPLFLFGLKKQGPKFTLCAIYTVAIYAISAFIINDVLPIDVSVASPFAEQDLLLCAIFGGIISGVGSGLAIRFGGAMDGVEVMAVIFAKKLGITIGTFVMIYNVILYVICGVVLKSWILPLYSIVTYFAGNKTVDFIVDGFDRSKAANIVTVRPQEVAAALSEEFECGITITEAKGYYSSSKKTVLYIVINRFQVAKMKEIVHREDPQAYISISDIADVFSSKSNKDR